MPWLSRSPRCRRLTRFDTRLAVWMTKPFKLHTQEYELAVGRLLATSRRERGPVMQGQMKGILKTVIEITPPGSEGVKGGTRAAQKQGEAAVAADIRRVYGSPGDAYDLLADKDRAKASAFWFLHSGGGDDQAHRVLADATGKSFSSFDGGVLHRRIINKRGRVAGQKGKHHRFIFAVRDTKSLEEYIAEKQSHVYWLAAGWRKAMNSVGGSVPMMIGKHDAPGAVEMILDEVRAVLRAHNDVKFASNVHDMERRVQWALDKQTEKLIRQWDWFVRQQASKQNFKVS